MSPSIYLVVREFASTLRDRYGISGPRLTKSDIRRIYRDEGIRIDYISGFKNVRGAYYPPPLGPSVVISRAIPEEPQIFTMAHELKHHFFDQEVGLSPCDSSNQDALVEKSAEVFAAELMFPQELFRSSLTSLGVEPGTCSAEDLVHLKMRTRTTLSYAGICKMAEFLGYCAPGAFAKTKFTKLQDQIYGKPLYRRLYERRKANRRLS
jgi:IrrE N-terminal-like domain